MPITLRTNLAAAPLITNAPEYEGAALVHDQLTGSTMGRGLRSGLAGASAARQAYYGQVAEALGREQAARDAFEEAAVEQRRAAALAPAVSRLEDIGERGGVGDYVRAKIGEGVGSSLPAIGGAVVGGLVGMPTLGAMLPSFPAEAGETVMELRNDPKAMANTTAAQRLGISSARGGVNAYLESIVPSGLVKRAPTEALAAFRAAPLRESGKVIADNVVKEGVTEGLQGLTGQIAHTVANPERDKSGDMMSTLNDVAAGALGGTGFAAADVVGTGAQAALDGALRKGKEGIDAATPGVLGALDAAKEKLAPFAQRAAREAEPLVDAAKEGAGKMTDALRKNANADTLANGLNVPIDVAKRGLDATADWMSTQEEKLRGAARAEMQRMIDDPSTPSDLRAQAQDALSRIDEQDGWVGAAALVAGSVAARRIRAAADSFGKFLRGFKKDPKGKANMQRTADDEIIAAEMRQFLDPAVAGDEDLTGKLYSYLRQYFDKDAGYYGPLPTEVLDIFGNEKTADKALKTLHGLFVRAGVADPDQDYSARMNTQDAMRRRVALRNEIEKHLDLKWGDVSRAQLNELARRVETLMQGGTWGEGEQTGLTELFGRNTERALERLRPLVRQRALESKVVPEGGDLPEGEDDVDGTNELSAEDFGSDAPDTVFSKQAEQAGPKRAFVGSSKDGDSLWNLGHGDDAVRGEIQKRYDRAKKEAEGKGQVVRELTPLEYAVEANIPLDVLARKLGVDKQFGGRLPANAMLRNVLAARPERMLMTETADINEDPVQLTDDDLVELFEHGSSTRSYTVRKGPGAQVPAKEDIAHEGSTKSGEKYWRVKNDEGRHGRLHVKINRQTDPETGEQVPHPLDRFADKDGNLTLSAQQLITLMQKKKKSAGAFDEKTNELVGDQQLRALFAAGYASLVESGAIKPERGIVTKEGDSFKRINPATFPIFRRSDGKGGYNHTYLGVAGKEEAAKVGASAKELSAAKRTAATKPVPLPPPEKFRAPNLSEEQKAALKAWEASLSPRDAERYHMWRAERRADSEGIATSPVMTIGGVVAESATETETRASRPDYEYIDRDGQGNLYGSRKQAAKDARASDVVVKRKGKWVIRRQVGFVETTSTKLLSETEEFGANKKDDARVFDEFGNINTPRDKLTPEQEVAMLEREIATAVAEKPSLAKKLQHAADQRIAQMKEKLANARVRAARGAAKSDGTARVSHGEYQGPDKKEPVASERADVLKRVNLVAQRLAAARAKQRTAGVVLGTTSTAEVETLHAELKRLAERLKKESFVGEAGAHEIERRLARAEEAQSKLDDLVAVATLSDPERVPGLLVAFGLSIDEALATGDFATLDETIEKTGARFGAKFNKQKTADSTSPNQITLAMRAYLKSAKPASAQTLLEMALADPDFQSTPKQRRFIEWAVHTGLLGDVEVEIRPELMLVGMSGKYRRLGGADGKPLRLLQLAPTPHGMSVNNLVHEVVHAFTNRVMRVPTAAQSPLRQYLARLFEILKEQAAAVSIQARYGYTNLSEFISEFVGNPEFRDEVTSLELTEAQQQEVGAAFGNAIADSKAESMPARLARAGIDSNAFSDEAFEKLLSAQVTKFFRERFENKLGKGNDLEVVIGTAIHEMIEAAREETGEYSFNKQKTGAPGADPKTQQEVRDYVEKVLGPKVKVAFEENLPHGASGMWHENAAEEFITLAISALRPLSVAHHEAMHGFFSRLTKAGQAEILRILTSAANSDIVMAQLRKHLANDPDALAQLADPEERLAYMYQFWAAGKLNIGPETKSLFQKIANIIRELTGILRADQQAELILKAFHQGAMADVSVAGEVLAKLQAGNMNLKAVQEYFKPLTTRVQELIMTSEGVLMTSDNPALEAIAKLFNAQSGKDSGYFPAYAQAAAKYLNKFEATVRDAKPADLKDALEALQREDGVAPTDAVASKIYMGVRELLDDMYGYAKKAGLPIKERKNYFPRVWSVKELMARGDEFKQRLKDLYAKEIQGVMRATKTSATLDEFVDSLFSSLVSENGVVNHGLDVTEDEPAYSPFMQALNSRVLTFVKNEDFQDFFEPDLVNVVSSYVVQGTKRAEWSRRFGTRGEHLDALFEDATNIERAKGATPEDLENAMRPARRAIMAMSGTLGYDIAPSLRKASGVMMVYQNLRLLPLSLFSSLIDPLGIVIRGGTLKEAGAAFLRGMKEIMKGATDDEQQRIAEMLGTVDASTFLDSLGNMYSSVYLSGWQKKVNDAIFKFNGMEAWNRAMRTSATQAAIGFIKRHVESPTEHSERYLGELGLKAADVNITNGELDLTDPKIQQAVMRWVDGAVLRPNAAQRPAWASDPHWATFFHLKQFMYSFQKVILKRTFDELKHGNVAPIATLTFGYVPIMIAADMAKGVLQGFGDEPDWKKGWGPSDYIVNGVQRAGLLGVGQMAVDAVAYGPSSVAGPTVEQAAGLVTDPLGRSALRALPAQGLWSGMGGGAAESNSADEGVEA